MKCVVNLSPLRSPNENSGFTLLEVILALAILAGTMGALGAVLVSANRSGSNATHLSRAQMLAVSKMAQITSGAEQLSSVNGAAFDLDTQPRWIYSVSWENTSVSGLLAVQVVVQQDMKPEEHPVSYSLVRWMQDPGAILTEPEPAEDPTTTESGTTSASGGTTGAGGATGGGGNNGGGNNGGGQGGGGGGQGGGGGRGGQGGGGQGGGGGGRGGGNSGGGGTGGNSGGNSGAGTTPGAGNSDTPTP